ncbi:DUF3099 domain-containing protein [Rathayibacter sp. KR2-224]|uniref:DUF3099 domain-containing protein n=1 Tax=Rathayibacter sp. KR2-224 TaxID=3400913 RepID=UPI003C098FB0
MKRESITSLPASPAVDRSHRMIEYTIMMSIRVLCLVSLIWVRGWWIMIPAAGAIFLPYFAVVVANVAKARPSAPERPGSIVPVGSILPPADEEHPQEGAPEDTHGRAETPADDDLRDHAEERQHGPDASR